MAKVTMELGELQLRVWLIRSEEDAVREEEMLRTPLGRDVLGPHAASLHQEILDDYRLRYPKPAG